MKHDGRPFPLVKLNPLVRQTITEYAMKTMNILNPVGPEGVDAVRSLSMVMQ